MGVLSLFDKKKIKQVKEIERRVKAVEEKTTSLNTELNSLKAKSKKYKEEATNKEWDKAFVALSIQTEYDNKLSYKDGWSNALRRSEPKLILNYSEVIT